MFAWPIVAMVLLSFTGLDRATARPTEPDRPVCPVMAEGQDTLEFVLEVMRFVATNYDTGPRDNHLLDSIEHHTPDSLFLQRCLEVFANDQGTANCGMTSEAMTSILLNNGIKAYTYGFGFPGTKLTHQLVLVDVCNRLAVFDPHINYWLTDDMGEPVDLGDLIANALDTGFHVHYSSRPVLADMIVDRSMVSAASVSGLDKPCIVWGSDLVPMTGTLARKTFMRSYQDELASPCPTFVKRFIVRLKEGTVFTEFHHGLMLKTQPIAGAKDHLRVDSTINSILRNRGPKNYYTDPSVGLVRSIYFNPDLDGIKKMNVPRVAVHLSTGLLAKATFYTVTGKDGPWATRVNAHCPVCPVMSSVHDTLEFAHQVLAFVAKNADTGLMDNSALDSVMRKSIGVFPAQQLMDVMCLNRATASCWQAANLMTNILLKNGVDAYTYYFGFPDIELSHVMVLVKWRKKYLIFDPYLNYHMVDTLGQPIGMEEVLKNAMDPRFRVEYRSNRVMADMTLDVCLLDSNAMARNSSECVEWATDLKEIGDNLMQKQFSRSFEDEVNSPCPTFVQRFLAKLRYSTTLKEFHQGFLVKSQTVMGAPDHMQVDSLLYSIVRDQGPKWGYTN